MHPYLSLTPYYTPVLRCSLSITRLVSMPALKQSRAVWVWRGRRLQLLECQAHDHRLLMGKRQALPSGPDQENQKQ